MKKLISILICVILLLGIIVTANATDIDAIQPSGNTYIIGVTDKEVPILGTLPSYNAGVGTYVIVNGKDYIDCQKLLEAMAEQNNNELQNNNDDDNDDEDTAVTLPEEKNQSIEYQTNYNTINEEIFALINQVRQNNNLPVLTYNKNLQAAADLRAKECSIQFSHTRPDGSSCHSVITEDYFVVGENLLKADPELSTASMMVEAWMNSKGHRENILLQHFTETAIGVYIADDNITYVAQLFKG